MGKREFYDPYTMRVKEIPELIEELNKLIMPMQPGGRPISTVWGVLCEASRLRKEAEPDPDEVFEGLTYQMGRDTGQSYAADVIIRKIADGMGVDNFKLREVSLERPTVQGDQPQRHPDPSREDQPG